MKIYRYDEVSEEEKWTLIRLLTEAGDDAVEGVVETREVNVSLIVNGVEVDALRFTEMYRHHLDESAKKHARNLVRDACSEVMEILSEIEDLLMDKLDGVSSWMPELGKVSDLITLAEEVKK